MSDKLNVNYQKIITVFLGFISLALFVYILIVLKNILIPITVAIFLTYLFHPLLMYLRKYKIPKWLSLIFILLLIIFFYYLFGLFIVSNFQNFSAKLSDYASNLSVLLEKILAPFNLTVKEVAAMFKLKFEKFDIGSVIQELLRAGVIQNVFNSFSSVLGIFTISVIFWIFMILGKTGFEERLKDAFQDSRETIEKNIDSINTQLQSYLIIKTITSLVTGSIVTIILLIYNIDFAIFWGILTFIFNFIPNIGSITVSIFPILVSLLDYGLGFKTISLAVLLALNQNIIGNFVEPHYMGRHMDLSTVFVLFSLIFWGWVWGIVGMFLAVPIAASLKILCSNIEPLKPIAILMGSKSEDSMIK